MLVPSYFVAGIGHQIPMAPVGEVTGEGVPSGTHRATLAMSGESRKPGSRCQKNLAEWAAMPSARWGPGRKAYLRRVAPSPLYRPARPWVRSSSLAMRVADGHSWAVAEPGA